MNSEFTICEDIGDLLGELAFYSLGEETLLEASQVHLRSCAQCKQKLSDLRDQIRLCRQALHTDTISPGGRNTIWKRVLLEISRTSTASNVSKPPLIHAFLHVLQGTFEHGACEAMLQPCTRHTIGVAHSGHTSVRSTACAMTS